MTTYDVLSGRSGRARYLYAYDDVFQGTKAAQTWEHWAGTLDGHPGRQPWWDARIPGR